MSLIGKEVADFKVQAYQGNEFKEIKTCHHWEL